MLGRESIRVTEADPSNRTLLVSDLSMFTYDIGERFVQVVGTSTQTDATVNAINCSYDLRELKNNLFMNCRTLWHEPARSQQHKYWFLGHNQCMSCGGVVSFVKPGPFF